MPAYVITGGPGSGKTSLLEALGRAGFAIVPEVSRALIKSEIQSGGQCLPWIDLASFARKCLETMQTDFRAADPQVVTFFDRGMPDVLGYLKVGAVTAGQFEIALCRTVKYAGKVFLAPPWEEIYVKDDERWQTYQEACALSQAIGQAYTEAGYEVIRLPFASVAERVEYIVNSLNDAI